jgi:hypothetical protein
MGHMGSVLGMFFSELFRGRLETRRRQGGGWNGGVSFSQASPSPHSQRQSSNFGAFNPV